MLAVTDCAIAAQNAVVAAESLGIGSCYIGDIMERCEEHRALLKLPPYVFPAVMLVFGYPTEGQKKRQKPERCDLKHIVHENGYRRMDPNELRQMLKKNAPGEDFPRVAAGVLCAKVRFRFPRAEMSRSVEAYLQSFRQ